MQSNLKHQWEDYKCSVNFKIVCENIEHFNQLSLLVINVLGSEKMVKLIFTYGTP